MYLANQLQNFKQFSWQLQDIDSRKCPLFWYILLHLAIDCEDKNVLKTDGENLTASKFSKLQLWHLRAS